MPNKIRMFTPIACALAMAAMSASCSKSEQPATPPSRGVELAQKAPFPGGVAITPADLTATPAPLPAPPPAYDPKDPISHAEYARFAWRQFIHFNSPAQKNGTVASGKTPVVRGQIDPTRNFAASGVSDFYQSGKSDQSNFSSNLLVWETFAHRSELFPAGSAPQGGFPGLPPEYIFQRAKVEPDDARFNNLDEATQIGQNQIFFPKNGNTPSQNPYDDHIILFQAKVNQVEYDYIKSQYIAPETPDTLELPPSTSNGVTYEGESVEVKSAWREMTPGLIASGRYHTAEALYYVKDEGSGEIQARVGTFGLVGLHILRKMKNYPAFVYTTFEQVDSLKTPEGLDTGLYVITLYEQMNYDPALPKPQAIINTGPSRTQFALPLAGHVDKPHGYDIVAGSFNLPPGYAGPIKVIDPGAGTLDVLNVNTEVHQAMDATPELANSVWRHYRLVGIQVLPTNEDSSITGPVDPLTQDYYLANIVIESSQPGIQLFKGGIVDPGDSRDGNQKDSLLNQRSLPNIIDVPELPASANKLVMGGCMGCHGNARYPRGSGPSLFSFLISKDTMSGKGFDVDLRNESPDVLLSRARKYLYGQ